MAPRTGSTPTKPAADAPGTPDNGVPQAPTMAALEAMAEQAQAALAEAQGKVNAARDAEAARVRKAALADVTKAAEAIVAYDGGTDGFEAFVANAKSIWTTVSEMAKAAKVSTGSRSRGTAGGAIREGSDAEFLNGWLTANPGWHTVRQMSDALESAKGYGYKADGQTRNAADKLHNIGNAERRNEGVFQYRAKVTEDTSVLDGVTTPEAPAEGNETPTE